MPRGVEGKDFIHIRVPDQDIPVPIADPDLHPTVRAELFKCLEKRCGQDKVTNVIISQDEDFDSLHI
ncbi:MAG: hypothetical protein OSA95_13260, partial [Opitutales bacterium]|nr:hypothetical protein [Opitutales bacterium]